ILLIFSIGTCPHLRRSRYVPYFVGKHGIPCRARVRRVGLLASASSLLRHFSYDPRRGEAGMNNTNCRRRRLGWCIVVGVAFGHLLAGCSDSGSTEAEVIRPVKTTVVSAGADTHVRSFPGKAEASRKAVLAFQVSGLLVKFPVTEGQKVAKGELIGQLRE